MHVSGNDPRRASWFRSLNCDGWRGGALASLIALFLLVESLAGAHRETLYYERAGLARGEWWRLLSAHIVHLGWRHALFNSAGLVLLWVLFLRELKPWQWCMVAAASLAAIDAGLWWYEPTVNWYAGASGWLHGVFAVGAARLLQRQRDALAWAIAIVLITKLALEQWRGASLLVGGLPVVVDAHVFGAAGGMIAWLALAAGRKRL